MSTIIECPACTTRYKMNKAIPEGGRSVKCARCGNQWRLVPEGVVEETIELDEPEHNPVADAPSEPVAEAPDAAAGGDEGFPYGRRPERAPVHDAAAEAAEWQARRENLAARLSSFSEEPQSPDYDEPAAEEAPAEEETHWRGFEQHASVAYHESAAEDEAEAEDAAPHSEAEPEPEMPAFASRFAAPLHRHEQPEEEPEQEPELAPGLPPQASTVSASADEDAGLSWAQRMSRPWREITAAIPEPEPEVDEQDTENSIRNALRKALEQPEPPAARPRSNFDWDAFTAQQAASAEHEAAPEPEHDSEPEPERDYPPFRIPGHDPHSDHALDEDPPFKLSGASAKRPIYGDSDSDDVDGPDNAEALGDSAFQTDIEHVFRAGALPKKTVDPSRGKLRHDEPLTDFDGAYDEQPARSAGEGAAPGDEYDADTAALQAQLEATTDLTEYESARRGGGLAVAAAWAMFFSIISGLALGIVSFRQQIMTALPGTTSLYRAIGFSVASAGVDFADVSYRWTSAEGKPMIEVKGQVVNVTNRTVTVPRVLINVRDANSADSVKATASVQTDKLAPRETASFTLEFLSPPKNISQIELEFDQNR
ncbi:MULTISPECIES: zinc-ribbon domain-containing protein [Rhodomicrobium]|uniref:zinc-ribbon domain-containing protein n=1 Tax=Rhodomicrobium TaxID=1068 RepID=UPI000F73C975|nr:MULTISPECIES: zinc-ribbon domain-containing protein [Rhodomicrobium]